MIGTASSSGVGCDRLWGAASLEKKGAGEDGGKKKAEKCTHRSASKKE
jgi:hypothetical protein